MKRSTGSSKASKAKARISKKKNDINRNAKLYGASSSRAGATASGSALSGLAAFRTSPAEASATVALSGVDECAEYSRIVRLLQKRDGTTRAKAVTDLDTLFQQLPIDVLKSVITNFRDRFPRLCLDNFRLVRERTLLALRSALSRLGKSIAPHLPYLAGAWLCAQYDTASEVASVALSSFEATFPSEEKRVAARSFMKPSTLSFITTMVEERHDTLSDLSRDTLEDAFDRYDRALAAAVLCSQIYTQQAVSADSSEVVALFSLIWRRCSVSNRAPLRRAFFDLVSRSHPSFIDALPRPETIPTVVRMLSEPVSSNFASMMSAFVVSFPLVKDELFDGNDGQNLKLVRAVQALLSSASGNAAARTLYEWCPRLLRTLVADEGDLVRLDGVCERHQQDLVAVVEVPFGFFDVYFSSLWQGTISDILSAAYTKCFHHALKLVPTASLSVLCGRHVLSVLVASVSALSAVSAPVELSALARRRRLARAKLSMRAFTALGACLHHQKEDDDEVLVVLRLIREHILSDGVPVHGRQDISDAILAFVEATNNEQLRSKVFEFAFASFLGDDHADASDALLSLCSRLGPGSAKEEFVVGKLAPALMKALRDGEGATTLLGLTSLLPSPPPDAVTTAFIAAQNRDIQLLSAYAEKLLTAGASDDAVASFVSFVVSSFSVCGLASSSGYGRVFSLLGRCHWSPSRVHALLRPFLEAAVEPLTSFALHARTTDYCLQASRATAVIRALAEPGVDELVSVFFLQFASTAVQLQEHSGGGEDAVELPLENLVELQEAANTLLQDADHQTLQEAVPVLSSRLRDLLMSEGVDADLWSHYVQALLRLTYAKGWPYIRLFPSPLSFSALSLRPSLYRSRDAMLAALELMMVDTDDHHHHQDHHHHHHQQQQPEQQPEQEQEQHHQHVADALALLLMLEERLSRELLSSPPDCAGATAAADLLNYWRRKNRLPTQPIRAALSELCSLPARSGLSGAITSLARLASPPDVLSLLEEAPDHVLSALMNGVVDGSDAVVQRCIDRWSTTALGGGGEGVEALAVAVRAGYASESVLEALGNALPSLSLMTSLTLAGAAVRHWEDDERTLKLLPSIMSVLRQHNPEIELLNAALKALRAVIDHAQSQPESVQELVDNCLPLLSESELMRFATPERAHTLDLIADVLVEFPFHELPSERRCVLQHLLIGYLGSPLQSAVSLGTRLLSALLRSVAVSITLIEPDTKSEQESVQSELANAELMLPSELLELSLRRPEVSDATTACDIRRYLLAWHIVLDVIEAVDEGKKVLISAHLHRQNSANSASAFFDELLEHIFVCGSETMPLGVDVMVKGISGCLAANLPLLSLRAASYLRRYRHQQQHHRHLFFGRLASRLYLRALRDLPVLSRLWWTNCERSLSAAVAKLTAKSFSHVLLDEEMSLLECAASSSGGFSLRCSRSTREVSAVYTSGEIRLKLVITMADIHPLKTPKLDFRESMGVSDKRAKFWTLSITSMLVSRNSSITDGLMLWKRNVDQHFEGVEECPICYSVVHAVTSAMPKLQCRVCKHKFHSACIFKWFSSSMANTCPLCRSLF